MGRATIVSGGADGLYIVKIDTGTALRAARLAKLDTRLAELLPLIDTAKNYLLVQQVLEAMAEAPVHAAIATYVAATRAEPLDPAAVKAALDSYTKLAAKLQEEKRLTAPLQLKVDMLEAEQAQAKKDRDAWAALALETTQAAWCADLTEAATGDVATLEIPGEDKLVLLAPAAPVPVAEDGVLTAREVQSGPQVFWNAAALPGLQKWRPSYRRGVITALDSEADLADVALDNTDTSSAQALVINQTPTLSAVPVKYMTCNANAFEVGDRCVVKFIDRDWAKPQVVGFVDHPKACDTPDLHLIFWEAPMLGAAAEIVRSKSDGGVNYSGGIEGGGVFRSVGVVLESARMLGGMEITDTTDTVRYQIPAFYDGYPLLWRTSISKTVSSEIVPLVPNQGGCYEQQLITTTMHYARRFSWQKTNFCDGSQLATTVVSYQIFQPPYSSEPNSPGSELWQQYNETFTDYAYGSNIDDDTLAHPAVLQSSGPWAGWSALACYVLNGSFATYPDADTVTVDTLLRPWATWSLPAPKKNAASKPLADLAQMPARTAVDVATSWSSTTFAAAPLQRWQIDWGYKGYLIDGLKVRAVGKTVAWCWLTGYDIPGNPGQWVNISAINYQTGASANVGLPEFFAPNPLPADYIPPNVVLADTCAVLAKNDPLTAHFWVWVYTLDITAGTLALSKTITNKPGDLSGGGHVGLVQVVTPSLPANCYLIGAMRDETVCM